MNCYLCQSTSFVERKGQVRDAPTLRILECAGCGLVTLSSHKHIQAGFYEQSGMHGAEPVPIETWLKDTEGDDLRRIDMLMPMLPNRRLLDFGCGAGGFLDRARGLAASMAGIEPEERVRDHWEGCLTIYPDIDVASGEYDLITAFHVLEHLPDPRVTLRSLAALLAPGGRIVVEVPSARDALLTLYDSSAFQRFTYWSQHLYLFDAATLERLALQAGLRVAAVSQCQRYPLSNHLHWLSRGKPGGHREWAFLDSPELRHAYGDALARLGLCDTLIAYLEQGEPC